MEVPRSQGISTNLASDFKMNNHRTRVLQNDHNAANLKLHFYSFMLARDRDECISTSMNMVRKAGFSFHIDLRFTKTISQVQNKDKIVMKLHSSKHSKILKGCYNSVVLAIRRDVFWSSHCRRLLHHSTVFIHNFLQLEIFN